MSTVEYVRGLLVRAIEEKGGDYVYPHGSEANAGDNCVYVEDDKPSCIAGHVLHYGGVGISQFEPFEGEIAETLVSALTDWPDIAGGALSEAQAAQDRGETWDVALQTFDTYLADRGIVVES